MSSHGFGRLLTAMVTPFKDNGEVDYRRARELARRLVDNATETLVVCGTTGESPTLTAEEKLRLFSEIKEEVGSVPVVAGSGSNNTAATIEFSKQAKERGADGLLVVAPYYNKPPQSGLLEHYRAVAEAVDLPIIVYNIPGRTGIEIKPDTLAQLAKIPNIVAVKEAVSLEPICSLEVLLSDPNYEYQPLGKYERWVRPGRPVELYSGEDNLTLPMMSVGVYGVVSVAAHVAGPQMSAMMRAYAEGRVKEAKALHTKLYPLCTGLFATTNPILPKAALALQGFPVGGLRRPLVEATPEQIATLKAIMERAGVL
ncbi:4-hydroxy-tetrahydrodipicolinate synthase [bacterium]|nr:4-hydroxy-tetrahydrodipicolinate synthase [bacterium]